MKKKDDEKVFNDAGSRPLLHDDNNSIHRM